MAKNKKRKVSRQTGYNRHHILWERRHWNSGIAKELRNHDYMIKLVPAGTLHREIHENIRDIPLPEPRYIEQALNEINRLMRSGSISLDDPLTIRLDLLIFLWSYVATETVEALKKQRQIVAKYEGRE